VSGRGHRSGIGFGGAVGLGVALALVIAVIAIGHAIFRQVAGAAAVVVVFATIAVCAVFAAVTLAAVGLLAKHGQLARLEVAERRLDLERRTREVCAVRAEVLEADGPEGDAEALPPRSAVASIQRIRPGSFPGSPLYAMRDRDGRGPRDAS
jgi:hypothetical protein